MQNKNIKYLNFTILFLNLLFFILVIPINNIEYVYANLIQLFVVIFYIQRFKRKLINENVFKSHGFYFFILMHLISIIGTSNYYIVNYVYESYKFDSNFTCLYWTFGMIFFAEGYLNNLNKKYLLSKIVVFKTDLVFFTFLVSLLGLFIIYIYLGYIPFIEKVKLGQHNDDSFPAIAGRMYSLINIAGIMFLIYYYLKKNKLFLIISLICFILTFFLNIRMTIFTYLVSNFLIFLSLEKNQKVKNFLLVLLPLFFLIFNFLFNSNRTIENKEYMNNNELTNNKNLNSFQSKIIYGTFNEYAQLMQLMDSYDNFYYGKTFLNIPLAFIPSYVLLIFNEEKSEFQKQNNSAIILSKHLGKLEESGGLRTGIMGELFINFYIFGCIFMYIMGYGVKFLSIRLKYLHKNDLRYVLSTILFVYLIYSLIGQIDGIGSLIANVLFYYLVISFIRLPKIIYYNNNNNKYIYEK